MTFNTVPAQLTRRLVGDIRGQFFIPDYQRGYRWGKTEVEHLLEDVKESTGRNYYLQPVVVKRIAEDHWELVDGQQRLTTLYLILQYIANEHLEKARAKYSMNYETRPDSAGYLKSLDSEIALKNIDFYHIFTAYEVIKNWFVSQPDELQAAIDFYTATTKHLQVIWYEAAASVDAKELFRRLNVGRIPLTDSELVKALLLARIRTKYPDSGRALEVALQWDVIEQSLRRPEVWAFVSGQTQREATHIGLLLDALADQLGSIPRGNRPLFHTFETLRPELEDNVENVWERIQDFHSLLIGWYDHRETFHLVGYLIATGDSFGALAGLGKNLTRSVFREALVNRIRSRLELSADGVRELTYQSSKSYSILLLMNVMATHVDQRYSFEHHVAAGWSLEHIHAQNAEMLTRAEQWKAWLKDHLSALETLDSDEIVRHRELRQKIENTLQATTITESNFRNLETEIVAIFSPDDLEEETHTIANLALLSAPDNSALNNSVFAVKRTAILSLDKQGAYIPTCTRNVFLKYYTPQANQQLHIWSRADRTNYLNELLRLVTPYLLVSENAA